MASSVSRHLKDWFIATFGLGVVASGMAAIDETSRQHLCNALRGEFPTIPPAFRYHALAKHVSDIFPIVDPSFIALGLVALVLVFVMFRT